MQSTNKINGIVATIVIVGFLLALILVAMWGLPKYRIYKQDLRGQATLREQEWEKKVLIEQAKAQNESATLNAEARIKQARAEAWAEVERAKGAAEANKIIADSLKGNEDYLRYLWITGLQEGENQVIYIPTEAGLPILEAGKR